MAKKDKPTIQPDDVSGRMFKDAFNSALEKCDGSVWKLGSKLGLKSSCDAWTKDHYPPYKKMKKFYFKLVDIADGK